MPSLKPVAAVIALLACCTGLIAASAGAAQPRRPTAGYRHLPMLGVRSCGGLLGRGSFPNAIDEEVNPIVKTHSGSGSICVFMSPEPTEAERAAGEHPVGGGSLTLNIYDRTEYEFRGKERNLASFIPFPAGVLRSPTRIGSHAYVGEAVEAGDGTQPELAFGVAQIRNDVAIVQIELPSRKSANFGQADEQVRLLLKSVISDLCRGCRT